jgi:DNA (cytosine-5)-methyltransferase 1
MKRKFKVLSLFSGAGGLDIGFESSGSYESIACIEANAIYSETLRINKGLKIGGDALLNKALILNCSVRDFLDDQLRQFSVEEIDGVVGGPPCQPFSTIGKRLGMADPRATTLSDYADVIRVVRPKFFLFENVPNLAWQWDGSALNDLLALLENQGRYRVEWKIVNAADYGAFTKRKRLIVLGIRDDCLKNRGATFFPPPTNFDPTLKDPLGKSRWRTVADALIRLGSPNTNRTDFPTHHIAVTHSEEVVQRFKKLQPGEQDKKRKRWRLDNNQPSNSLMAGGDGGFVFHIHPTLPRELTSRECARIQGFPDDFLFAGKPLDVAKQIVNAVPIQLGYTLASSLAITLGDK